jgi:hypothetical protein
MGGYRSFGSPQRIGPLTKVNLFAGTNNSGKSNILKFAHDQLPMLLRKVVGGGGANEPLDELDRHRPSLPQLAFGLAWRFDGDWIDAFPRPQQSAPRVEEVLRAVFAQLADSQGLLWFDFEPVDPDAIRDVMLSRDWCARAIEALYEYDQSYSWQTFAQAINRSPSGDLSETVQGIFASLLRSSQLSVPEMALIPAYRRIGTSQPAGSPDFSGSDIIHRLAELQHPDIHHEEDRKKFNEIERFVGWVIGDTSAELEVPAQRHTLHVFTNGRRFPLENVGTGIHEVTILAAHATLLENAILCVEEPEIHLHPVLQRKLIEYLETFTSNQYLIATHSAHLVDYPAASLFHARLSGGESTVSQVASPAAHLALCADLGYRASDLLQANSVIWVEGPTDRLYIRHWLTSCAPELIEGLHYSIMFYGGRLLSHLTADDDEVTEFISLRRINQHLSIVIDSDKAKSSDQLNATKRRIRREFDEGPGFAWITKGREIENYIEKATLELAIGELYPNHRNRHDLSDPFSDVLALKRVGGQKDMEADKVKVAHQVVSHPADLSPHDLRVQVERLVAFIRSANGLKTS